MSTGLQKKLFNYEVTPPVTAWDRIASELDESCMLNTFPGTLSAAEAVPPAAAWTAIAAGLDVAEFPGTLYNASAIPPPGAWDKIRSSLDETEKRGTGRLVAFMRFAAAAAIIAAVAFGATRLFMKNDKAELANENASTPFVQGAPVDSKEPVTSTIDTGLTTTMQEQQNEEALEASKHTYASLNASEKKKLSRVTEEFFAPAATISVSAAFAPENTYRDVEYSDLAPARYAAMNPAIDMAGRYAMLMKPDGQIIRISRKLGSLVCCVSGEEQDAQCVDQMNKWKARIANADVAPAPGNFMGIIDILQSLNDNGL